MTRVLRCLVVSFGIVCFFPFSAARAANSLGFDVKIHAGQHDRTNVPVSVPIELPADAKNSTVAEIAIPGARPIPGEVTEPGICVSAAPAASGSQRKELHFILPELKAGATLELHGTIEPTAPSVNPSSNFNWTDVANEHSLLSYGSRPVLDYMCRPLDESSEEKRFETFKPYHHLYDPDGKFLVTKGPGGLYPHHRALFYGFNKITYGDGKEADVWHCTKNCYQSHEKLLGEEAGPVLGRHLVAIDWHGQDRQPFAHEQREMTVYDVPGGTLIDFASRLETAGERVKLDGDPQHSGFHFRASQEVADQGKADTSGGKKTADKPNANTVFIRVDGVGEPGKAINWDPKDKTHDPRTINQPWKGMSFILRGQRYTVAMLDLPTNPKEARFSERDYGRFGSYFQHDLTKDHPLEVRYRVWLQKGQMTPEQIAARAADFAEPVEATAKLAGNERK
jgi:Methane oxygenase PmoA